MSGADKPGPGVREVGSPLARLRVALVGAGLVGQAAHAPTLREERQRFDFVAVADPSPTVRREVAARYAVPHAVATIDEALALDLDAVVIAAPDPVHRPAVLAALRRGVHVFCEKPLAISVAEVDEILAARGDLVVQVGTMKRYDPALQRMVERLLDGPAELVHLTVEVNDPEQAPFVDHLALAAAHDVPIEVLEAGRSRGREAVQEALGGEPSPADLRAYAAYLGSLVHDVSLAHHLLAAVGLQPPFELAAAAAYDAGRGVSLDWRLPGDRRAHLEHLNLPGVPDYRERVTAYCRDRILELTFPSPYLRHVPTSLTERRPDGTTAGLETVDYRVSYEEAFRSELRAFHSSITAGDPVVASVEAARVDLVALIDAFRLAVRGRAEAEKPPLG